MPRLRLSLPANDRAFLATVRMYIKILAQLALFKLAPSKVASLEQLEEGANLFEQYLDGSKNGDRVQAALKNRTRKAIKALLVSIFHFLESVADEEDLVVLQQEGLELAKARSKKKAVVPSTN